MNFLLFIFAFFAAVPAQAYTPPTGYILNQALKNRESLKEINFEGKVTDLKRNYSFKEKVQINFLSGKVSLSYLGASDEALGATQTTLENLHRLGKFWFGVALDPNGPRFKKDLEELNAIPHEKSVANLTRIGNKVMWSWGDECTIQFYKDEFLASDYQAGIGDSAEEIFLKEYTSSGAAVRVPRTVLIKQKGKDDFSFELKALKLNTLTKEPLVQAPLNSPSVSEWTALVR